MKTGQWKYVATYFTDKIRNVSLKSMQKNKRKEKKEEKEKAVVTRSFNAEKKKKKLHFLTVQ